ncbi:Signal transduction histidine kinase [Nocardioides terrae]|uniref:Sensor-like histidine kinase SenX3 n=1 Tax=Nocardioides terrae TaxID=574651 RepID=A0A1I1EUK0_9ACTN|nr:ATP-binding protein [Nocardioides terrae]SFB88603.1 Signal transduction histidine kinase [Nocardioides terrae]
MSDPAVLAEPATASGRWLDDVTRSALQLIADALVELAGFEVAAIGVVRDDEMFHTAVVSGGEDARARMSGAAAATATIDAELARGEAWGRFTFVPADRRTHAREPAAPHRPGTEDSWHPGDLLLARLYDSAGELRGVLAIDEPEDGRRPGSERRVVLERFATLAERAIVSALERARLVDQVRLLDATRDVIRQASSSIGLQDVLERTGQALLASYGSTGVWLRLFGVEDGAVISSAFSGPRLDRSLGADEIAERAAHKLWNRQQVGALYADDVVNFDDTEDRRTVQASVRELGIGSLLLVPLGVGDECLGSLTVARSPSAPRWTAVEMSSAFALGGDLGQLLFDARAYEREQQVAQELQALDAYKNQLITNVTGELRRPLSAIVADLEAIRGGSLSADAGQALGAMDRTTARMVGLVEDLVLLSRVTDPDNRLQPGRVELVPIVHDVVELCEVATRERGVTLRVQTPATLPVAVLGDAAELDRLVVNLVSNAVKYSREGGTVTITLAARREDDQDLVELVVADDGIGISEEDLGRLFTEFFRSTNPAALARPGTGLGLAIVDRIVRRHGGRIAVDSTVAVGTTFRVLLPEAP